MALTLISTSTASASATLDITSGITSTYDSYEFHFVNMHPATDSTYFKFQVNAAGLTGFNEVMTTTAFQAYHNESDSATVLDYYTGVDQAQGTAYQHLSNNAGNDNDQSVSGVLTLYAPSSTTYVKHFVARSNTYHSGDYSIDLYFAGYINTTAAIDEISFKFNSGNTDAGTIKMFGVS
tara:strand:- start:531 stop:1067 length:537 start_codon:yes stop_codon:yes gene_type:complete